MMMRLISLFLWCLAVQVQSFATAPAAFAPARTVVSLKEAALQQSSTRLWSTPEEQEGKAVAPKEPEGTQYPVDVPSPILLGSSMILAIGVTGKLQYVEFCWVERW
jgi:hypothetical protein